MLDDADTLRLTGARSRIPRSIRGYECKGCEVDFDTAFRTGSGLLVAVESPAGILYQAEAHVSVQAGGKLMFLR